MPPNAPQAHPTPTPNVPLCPPPAAAVAALLPSTQGLVEKLSIIPRSGGALGFTYIPPLTEDRCVAGWGGHPACQWACMHAQVTRCTAQREQHRCVSMLPLLAGR